MAAVVVALDVSLQVSHVTRCTNTGPPVVVGSRRPGGRSESKDSFPLLLFHLDLCGYAKVCRLNKWLIRSVV